MQKSSPFLLSLFLHGIILFAIVSYPTSRMVDLKRESYQVSLVVGAPNSANVSKVLGPKPTPVAKPQPPKPTPTPTEAKPAPAPKAPDAVAIPVKQPEIPKEEKPIAKPAPAPKPEPVPEPPKQIAQAAPAPKPEEEPKEEVVEAKPAPEPPKSAVFSALAELETLSKNEDKATSNENIEQAGGGIKDVYITLVMLAVQEEWSMPNLSRENYATEVLIHLDSDGTILDRRIEQSSGVAAYDASVINALDRLGKLPAPPEQELHTLTLVFHSQQ